MNRAGVAYTDRIIAWASYHPELFPEWIRSRIGEGGNIPADVWAHQANPGVTHIMEHEHPSGSSALLGARVALRLGFQKVVLVGCPLDTEHYAVYQEGWKTLSKQLQGRVRSMSGWLGQYLGFPVRSWLEEMT